MHFDPVNLINSPEKYYNSSQLINDFISRLGPYIKSCHAKDISLRSELTIHLDETRPGLGNLDYSIFLKQLRKLPDVPILLEHLKSQNEYTLAANYIRSVAKKNGLSLLKV